MEFDFIIIGSGFGGSVSALRLAEKGYKVAVLEAGRRFGQDDFPKTNWNLRKYVHMPKLGLHGFMRYSLLPDVLILSGAGVGGGSLVYCNTLYVPPDSYFNNKRWSHLADWKKELMPHYETAKRMLGVVTSPFTGVGDLQLKQVAEDLGRGETFKNTPVAVYFGEPGVESPDPYFNGEGPARSGCTLCGGCMVGCRHNAKNTLDKNYLYLAEKKGVRIFPEHQVTDIRVLQGGGYEIDTQRTGAWFKKENKTFTAGGVVLSAGVLGTIKLLMSCKAKGSLPNISDQLGKFACTNSESLVGASARKKGVDYSEGIAISASIFPDDDTHVEVVRFPKGSDVNSFLSVYLTGDGNRLTRPLKFFANFFLHPIDFIKTIWPFGWAEKSSILLVMQTLENYIHFIPKGKKNIRLSSVRHKEQNAPAYIPMANEVAIRMAEKMDGIPQSSLNEVLLNIPVTAHILGGASIGSDASSGVIDTRNQLFGYKNFFVCDGSMIPANLGVNPSLTITAMSEYAMSHIPTKSEHPDFSNT